MARLAALVFAAVAVLSAHAEYRTIDGSNNNLNNPTLGAENTAFSRFADPAYSDGISSFSGEGTRPNPRDVSNAIFSQTDTIFSKNDLSDLIWQWGQFLDHDLTLTPPEHDDPSEVAPIQIPAGDMLFDPQNTGNQTINFERSQFDPNTGVDSPREQINIVTHWIDGSQVYGSNDVRAAGLRTMSDGLLKTSSSNVTGGDFLPLNTINLPNENFVDAVDETLFLAGDVRSNDQIGLMAIHTLFVREHNRLATALKAANNSMSDEELYQAARKIVGAEMQTITYNEWLPALLGPDPLSPYMGYNSSIDGTVRNEFSTASLRVGHTMLSSNLSITVCDNGQPMSVSMRDVFFTPEFVLEIGIDPILKGFSVQAMQEIDNFVIDDVRNFLFGEPGNGGMDLVSLNVHRGRDHGITDFNSLRVSLGLEPYTTFSQITSDTMIADALEILYETTDNIDPWVGNLCEDHISAEASFGQTLFTVFKTQFELLRDGDRFFYLNDPQLVEVLNILGLSLSDFEDITFSDILLMNTNITSAQANIFIVDPDFTNPCDDGGSGPDEEDDAAMATHTVSLGVVVGLAIGIVSALLY